MNIGTFKVSREIWSDPAFRPAPMSDREAFIWMISQASWREREYRVGSHIVPLRRGELAASLRGMAEAWEWSMSAVNRYMKRLENRNMIETDTGTGVLRIRLCNYEKYQGDGEEAGTPIKRHPEQHRNSTGTIQKKERKKEERVSLAAAVENNPPREAPMDMEAAAALGKPEVKEPAPQPKREVARGTPRKDPLDKGPPTPREAVLEAMGLPRSGMHHDRPSKPRGGMDDQATLGRWLEKGLTVDEICAHIRERLATARAKPGKEGFMPGTFSYFTEGLMDYLAAKTTPLPQGDASKASGGAPKPGSIETDKAARSAYLAKRLAEIEAEEAHEAALRAARNGGSGPAIH